MWIQSCTLRAVMEFMQMCVRAEMWGDVERCWFWCNYSFICRRRRHRVLCSHWISSPRAGHHMCTSERQSNMAAIYTLWVRWKLLAPSLRPRSPKRMGKKTDKAGKRPVNFYILGCLGCFPMAGRNTGVHARSQQLQCVCGVTAHTHTHSY